MNAQDHHVQSEDDITILGSTDFRGIEKRFGIKRKDRRQHTYILGRTGVGKSTLLISMIAQDIARGEGIAVIDPHGDLADKILTLVPKHRTNDLVLFDPSDQAYPIAFNFLETTDSSDAHFVTSKILISSGLISVFKKLWSDSWGPRLEYLLRNAVLALLESNGQTLLGITRMFTNESFRQSIVCNVRDPIVKSFWTEEFASYNDAFRSDAASPILNKVGQFLSTSLLRNIVCQPKSTLNFDDLMNSRMILIANLSKGKIGEDNAALLGAILITKLQLAAMQRAAIPESDRSDFHLYVDEFQNFATDSFAEILSEARKFKLNLTIANQYLEQLPRSLSGAILGNVGNIICFRLGAPDAELLQREFMPEFGQFDLAQLANHSAYIRMTVDGATCKPFSMKTELPNSVLEGQIRAVNLRKVSRERYGRSKEQVEERIRRWFRTSTESS